MSKDFLTNDISAIHTGLVNKDFSVSELVESSFKFIDQTDKELNAFITLDKENALTQAKQLDEKGVDANNPLSGIPFALKDNIVTNGLKTTAASKILEYFVPVYDATVTAKLKDTNAINMGKVNMDEFAMGGSTETSYFGVTKNAWNNTKVPGGSSGGSAAAVAAGQVMFSLGSDTGGSIRQPSAYNGIVGLKPTYGRVSRWGLIAFGSSFDQIGPLTRTVKDSALVLNAIAGHDEHDNTSVDMEVPDFTAKLNDGIKGMKIGVPQEFFMKGVTQEVQDSVRAGIKQLEALGAEIVEISLPHTKYGIAAYYILASSEASSNLQRFDGVRYGLSDRSGKTLEEMYVNTRTQGFGEEVKRRIMLGTFSLSAGFFDAYFQKAAKVRTKIIQDFNAAFEKVDLIVGPTSPSVAFGIGEENSDPETMYMNDVLTIPVNMAGLPALSINSGFNDEGLPIGMQMIGKSFDEQTLFQAASAYEQATRLFEKFPGGDN